VGTCVGEDGASGDCVDATGWQPAASKPNNSAISGSNFSNLSDVHELLIEIMLICILHSCNRQNVPSA
jgi:hypothetical protein